MFTLLLRRCALVLAALTGLTFPANPVGDTVWWSLDSGPFSQSPRDVLTEHSPANAVRTFGDYPGMDVSEAARRTVASLASAGGFERRVMVVAVPTGSGWVEPTQVEAVEQQFNGAVATVAVRYSSAPSAAVMVMHRELAQDSLRALLSEIQTHLRTIPESQRPALVLQGLSLGAQAGSTVLAQNPDLDHLVAARLWRGMPGGSQDRSTSDTDCTISVVNDDDPVGEIRGDLWLHPVRAIGVLKDLPGSETKPAGTAHSYRPLLPPARCLNHPDDRSEGANTVRTPGA